MRTPRALFLLTLVALWPNEMVGQDGAPAVLTLRQCEELALANNLTVQGAELGLATSQAKQRQAARANILPRFDLRNIWGPSNRAEGVVDPETGFVTSPDTTTTVGSLRYFTQVDVDLLQPLFTFGRLRSLADAATFGVRADEFNLEHERESVRLQVRELYWALVLGQELLAIVEDTQTELRDAEEKVQDELDAGSEEVTQIDLFRLQIARYENSKRVRAARDNIVLTEAALRSTLGLVEGAPFAVATEYLEPLAVSVDSLTRYWDLALEHRPELGRLRAGLQAKHALVRAQRSEYYPQLFLGGRISYNYAQDRFDPKNPFLYNPANYFRPSVVLGVNMKLNFWHTSNAVGVAEAELLQLAQRETQLLVGIKLEVQKRYVELRQAQQNMLESRRAATVGRSWLRSATMTFDLGVGEVKELIDAFVANNAMQAEHLRNIFGFNVALARLGNVIGVDIYPD